ncbi:MAG: STT3 domain-containing protein [Candidatus Hydrothermarchaeota archaeon]|nr:STT3 domain-containing protein [Candidatus Hydrothermarchaeota archaeon]
MILAVLDIANRKYLKEHKRAKVALPLVFLFAIILFGYSTGYFETLGQKISYAVNVGTVKTIGLMEIPFEPWNIGITEQRKVGIEYLAYIYNILIFIFPLGFLFLLRQKFSFKTIFSSIFVLSSLSLLIFQIRFTFIVSPAVCLLAALPLYCLSIQKNWKRHISLILIFLLIFTNACAAAKFSSSAQPLVTSDLYEGLTWIRKNTPEDSIILSWWDYTGPILAAADRKTVTHTAPSGIVESTALAFRTSNETQALEIIKSMNEDFVLRDMKVDYILLDFRIYSLWPKILILEPYVNRPLKVENKDLFQSVLHNMYTKQKLENFKLVFSNRDVRIYEPIYNYTRIIEIETKRYCSKNEEVKIKIKTKSNEFENVILKINVTDPQKNLIFTKEEPIEGTSQRDIFFTLLGNTTKGTYTILTELYSPQMKKVHSMKRNFIVIN